jgi:hypothetical protein
VGVALISDCGQVMLPSLVPGPLLAHGLPGTNCVTLWRPALVREFPLRPSLPAFWVVMTC